MRADVLLRRLDLFVEEPRRQTVEAGGAQVVTLENRQEFVDAVRPVYEKFAGTPALKSMIERIEATN